jgi:hypothetical protein
VVALYKAAQITDGGAGQALTVLYMTL